MVLTPSLSEPPGGPGGLAWSLGVCPASELPVLMPLLSDSERHPAGWKKEDWIGDGKAWFHGRSDHVWRCGLVQTTGSPAASVSPSV